MQPFGVKLLKLLLGFNPRPTEMCIRDSTRMYELGAQRAGVAPEQCVFVDDLPFNLTPAEELGMATVHHTSSETTIPELERILGVTLA